MLISFKDLVKKYGMIITGVIHVGGHYGEELQDYIDEGIQDMVLFEPLDENFNILKEKAENLNESFLTKSQQNETERTANIHKKSSSTPIATKHSGTAASRQAL